jgi:chromosome segregation ATPase
MFDGIKRFIRNVRIDVDFSGYDREMRAIHESAASRRYCWTQLEKEIGQFKQEARIEADTKFGADLESLDRGLAVDAAKLMEVNASLSVFSRSYKDEFTALDTKKESLQREKSRLIEKKKSLQAERTTAKEELDEAYARLESAQDDVESWYAKSERSGWLFGNAGNKIPNHSLFGQSHGDLDGYKSDRDEAGRDIGTAKDEISRIRSAQQNVSEALNENSRAIDSVFEQIKKTKAASDRWIELRKHGITRQSLQSELAVLAADENKKRSRRIVIELSHGEFIRQRELQFGVPEREAQVNDLKARKAQFIAEFDFPVNEAARKSSHREKWLKEHGVVE